MCSPPMFQLISSWSWEAPRTSDPASVLNGTTAWGLTRSRPQIPDQVPLSSCSLLCIRAAERNLILDQWSEHAPSIQSKVPAQAKRARGFDRDCKHLKQSWYIVGNINLPMTQPFTASPEHSSAASVSWIIHGMHCQLHENDVHIITTSFWHWRSFWIYVQRTCLHQHNKWHTMKSDWIKY